MDLALGGEDVMTTALSQYGGGRGLSRRAARSCCVRELDDSVTGLGVSVNPYA